MNDQSRPVAWRLEAEMMVVNEAESERSKVGVNEW